MTRQFSAACERNREPIAAVLRNAFAGRKRVLEIGSGTGQHAVHFAAALPHLVWQPSDRPPYHASIVAWQEEARLANVLPPLTLDVNDDAAWYAARDAADLNGAWPANSSAMPFDAVFSANTCHIMAWREVRAMFAGIGRILQPGGVLCIYGPFNYGGRFTSPSNADFDAALKLEAPHMGIRDFEAMNALAATQGLVLQADHAMPANNRLLVWRSG